MTAPPGKDAVTERLIRAIRAILMREGFQGLTQEAVAKEAGQESYLVTRHFGGLAGLLKVYAVEADVWPTAQELAGGDPDAVAAIPPAERFSFMTRNYIRAIRARPITQELMVWELLEANDLTRAIKASREAWAMMMMERFVEPELLEAYKTLGATVAASSNYLAMMARTHGRYNGLDLGDEAVWRQIEAAHECVIRAVVAQTQAASASQQG